MSLQGSDLTGRDLRDRALRGADLRNCRLVDCDLRGVDLTGANLSGSDLTGARLEGADLRGAILADTIGAVRNGGPVVSIVGLQYPVVIDGKYAQFGCEVMPVTTEDMPRSRLLKMDKAAAVRFRALGAELLAWYRQAYK